MGVQVCPLYAAGAHGEQARELALAQWTEFQRATEENADFCGVSTRADLDDPRLRLVLSMEGVEPLAGDPDAFDGWYVRGVRSVGLTWNDPNEFAGGINSPTVGLTDRGRVLVRHLAELDVMLDLAHASEQTWRDILDEDVPFSVTHANCRAVHDHPRNLADWQLRALAECGGVLGMMAIGFVVHSTDPTIARWLDHFDHAVALMGIDHVGIGADFIDQIAPASDAIAAEKASVGLADFTGPDDYPTLITALHERGYRDVDIDAIASANWLRILHQTMPGR